MDLVISLAELSPKTAAFAAVAGPIKEALFPKPDLKDISKQLDKMSREIKNKVENEHRHTRIEIARQAEIVKLMLEFIFDSENPKDLMRRLLSKRTKVYFSNGTPDQYYKDDR